MHCIALHCMVPDNVLRRYKAPPRVAAFCVNVRPSNTAAEPPRYKAPPNEADPREAVQSRRTEPLVMPHPMRPAPEFQQGAPPVILGQHQNTPNAHRAAPPLQVSPRVDDNTPGPRKTTTTKHKEAGQQTNRQTENQQTNKTNTKPKTKTTSNTQHATSNVPRAEDPWRNVTLRDWSPANQMHMPPPYLKSATNKNVGTPNEDRQLTCVRQSQQARAHTTHIRQVHK